MLIKMNTEHLRMTVLKQIVDNATKAMVIDRKELYLIGYFHLHQKYTTQKCGSVVTS